jgi:hypothetical protein
MKKILFIFALASLAGCCKNDCGPYSSSCFKVDTKPSGCKSVDYVPQVQQVDTYQPVNVQSSNSSSNCQCSPCSCNPCGC